MSAGGITCNWRTIVYPDSAPDTWLSDLRETLIPFAISPLHDKDQWSEDDYRKDPTHIPGEYKKAHYHLLWYYPNTKTEKSAQAFSDLASGVKVLPVQNPQKAYEYLWHKNDNDKYPYEENDVRLFNGFNVDKFVEMTKEQEKMLVRNIQLFIYNGGITCYRDLCDQLIFDDEHWDWYKYVSSHTMHYNAYFKAVKKIAAKVDNKDKQ